MMEGVVTLSRTLVVVSLMLLAPPSDAAELSSKTAAAFDKYVAVAEQRIARETARRGIVSLGRTALFRDDGTT